MQPLRTRLRLWILIIVSMLAPSVQAMASTFVYVSAATDKTILIYRLDPKTGELTPTGKVDAGGEPAALIATPDRKYLLASIRAEGKLASFRIDQKTGGLTRLSLIDAGADPAHISTDPTGRFLFTAYYVAAKVSVHEIQADGQLVAKPVQDAATTEKAHAAMLDPSGRFLFVPHTAPNRIEQFRWNTKNHRLTHNDPPSLLTPPNSGPRHLAWNPRQPVAYIDNEQGSSVTAYRLDRERGTLEFGETKPTIPADFSKTNSCAELRSHPSGTFLYVANRGHDSLAGFKLDASGEHLESIGQFPTETTPRSFDISPDGRHLIAAGESSGRLAIYEIDLTSGFLKRIKTLDVAPKLWWVYCLEL